MSPSSTLPTPTPVYPGQASSSWTVPTPPPVPIPSISSPSSYQPKRKRRRKNLEPFAPRQTIVDQDAVNQAKQQCQVYSGNDVESCFPTSDDSFPQHEWATFVWNGHLPQYQYNKHVDIYLFQAWTQQPIMQWESLPINNEESGVTTAMVNDTWWGEYGANWNGSDIPHPMFWVITPAGQGISNGAYTAQPTFTAVQTTYADFVVASMSSASVSSASVASQEAKSASLASLSLFSETETLTSGGSTQTVVVVGGASSTHSSIFGTTTLDPTAVGGKGNVQSGSSNSHFPHWAIAVIVVLGVLAILTGGILVWLIMRRLRRRRASSNRTSTNSGTPMLDPNSGSNDVRAPLMAEAGLAGAGLGAAAASHKEEPQPKSIAGDAASTISRAHSESAPFSGADAAIMADAFRKALRKPEFPGGVEEGDTPESAKERREAELLGAELAQEGRDLRSVGSSHNVRVQSSSDHGHDDQSTMEEHT